MLNLSRGRISKEDVGANERYYLFVDRWYRTISPSYFGSEIRIYVTDVYSGGGIGSGISDADGGVQFIGLC